MKIRSLSGVWQYAYLPHIDIPETTAPFAECTEWGDIVVPGCWDKETDIPRRSEGAVIYKKTFNADIEADKVTRINFDAVNYYCRVWLNDQLLGENEGGWNSFSFDITAFLKPTDNQIYVLVIKQGEMFPPWETTVGFLPDIVYTYGGIYREVSLLVQNKVGVKRIILDGNPKDNSITAKCQYFNVGDGAVGILRIVADAPDGEALRVDHLVTFEQSDNRWISGKITVAEPILWDTEHPNLYTVTVSLIVNGTVMDTAVKRVGMRSIELQGSDILLNGTPIYLRGVLHWGWYSDTIAPNPTRAQIRDEIQKVKAHGFNMVKHCLYIPTDDYFELADEVGLLLWQEFPMWLPDIKPALIERYNREYPHIMEKIAGHACTVIFTIGCELDDTVPESFLKGLFDVIKHHAMGALITDNSGSGECYGGKTTAFAEFYDYHFYAELHNFENLMEVFTPHCRQEKPWLYGEFCDYDTICYTKDVIDTYGEAPWWLSKDLDVNPIYKNCHHYSGNGRVIPLMEQDVILKSQPYCAENIKRIAAASIRQGFLHRKFCIEETRKFPEVCGYNITVITDSPLSSSGIFDYKMDNKFAPDLFRNFNNDDVLALNRDLKRRWKNGGDRTAYADRYNYFSGEPIKFHMVLSHYSKGEIINPTTTIQVEMDDRILCEQSYESQQVVQCSEVKTLFVGELDTPLVEVPKKITVRAAIEGTSTGNQWDFYIYPLPNRGKVENVGLYDPTGIYAALGKKYTVIDCFNADIDLSMYKAIFATLLDDRVLDYMEKGGQVCYIQTGLGRLPVVASAFWRESVRMAEEHPITDGIVFDGGLELNAFGVATDISFEVGGLGLFEEVKPIYVRVDGRRYTASYYMFEGRYKAGSIVGTTFKFEGGQGKQPSGLENNKFAQVLIERIQQYLTKNTMIGEEKYVTSR